MSDGEVAELGHLRRFVWLDVATTWFAVAVILAAYALVESTGWLLVLGALVAAAGLAMWSALPLLAADRREPAVLRVALANWSIALATSTIAPFCWPLQLLAALLPAVIAAPHVPRARHRFYVGVSLAVSVGVAAAGLLQDVSGFQDQMPEWTTNGIVLLFTPFMGAMVVLTALQHSTRLRVALDATLAANDELAASRRRVVTATDRERRRVERDIHDGAQQRLTALRVGLRLAEERVQAEPDAAPEVFEALRSDVRDAHDELRRLAHGLYPTVLTQHGLEAGLAAAADRCAAPVELDLAGIARHDTAVEAAVYFCCAEALENASRHAGPDARVRVTLRRDGDAIAFEVSDDGCGFDPAMVTERHGLDNLADRMHAAGGELEVTSSPGAGTAVRGRISI